MDVFVLKRYQGHLSRDQINAATAEGSERLLHWLGGIAMDVLMVLLELMAWLVFVLPFLLLRFCSTAV